MLGPDVDVARWLDAAGTVRVGRGAVVHSRISSQSSIQLEEGAAAQSFYAPLIHTEGYQPAENYTAPAARQEGVTGPGDEGDPLAGLPNPVARLSPDTVLVRGEVELKPGSRVTGNLVVQGALRTGEGCILLGDVKADSVEIGPRNEASGNVVSAGVLRFGESCRVAKSVVAETDIVLAKGVRVGAPSELAVVSAGGSIRMEPDVAVWGKISAGKMATTVKAVAGLV
jgi:predicted acyltransferase (DUF342 family)